MCANCSQGALKSIAVLSSHRCLRIAQLEQQLNPDAAGRSSPSGLSSPQRRASLQRCALHDGNTPVLWGQPLDAFGRARKASREWGARRRRGRGLRGLLCCCRRTQIGIEPSGTATATAAATATSAANRGEILPR